MNIPFQKLIFRSISALIFVFFIGVQAGNAQYTFGGNASSLGNGCYQITPSSTNQLGYWYVNAPIDLEDTIHLKFRVNFGSIDANGGDGLVFVLRGTLGTPYVGTGGGDIGYGGGTAFSTNSLGIEMDTYSNSGKGDPTYDHLGIQKNGSTDHSGANMLAAPVQTSASSINVEDGNYHTFEVKWNPTTEELKVWFDCQLRIQYTGDLIDDVFGGDNLVHYGFTASTGAAINAHRICLATPISSLVTPMADESICKGDTVSLDAGSSSVTYLWSPALGLSATNTNDPDAYPNVTSTYVVRETFLCDTLYDTVTVNVVVPQFDLTGVVTNASCKDVCDGEVDLSVANGSSTYSYIWSNGNASQDVTGLCDGTYYVTAQDIVPGSGEYLCTVADTFFITEPALLIANIINPTKTKCPLSNNCDAEANSTGVGGTTPYSFMWSSGENINHAYQLCPGLNWVTVTDAKGCQSVDSVTILVPDPIETFGFEDTLICINNLAALAAVSVGGTPPYSYVWREGSLSGPVVSIASNDAVHPNLTTTYYVQSYDANGCLGDTADVLVKVRPPLDVEFIAPDTICPYDTITVEAVGVGGDSLYSYTWDQGFGPTLTISPDVTTWYKITVSDFCGTPFHIDSLKIQVGGYNRLKPNIRFEDDSLCKGESTYLIASALGGYNGPDEYIFTWAFNGSHSYVQFVSPTVTTKYVVKVEDLCLSQPGWDTLVVHVGEPDFPEVTIEPAVACKESDVVYSIDKFKPGYDYYWQIDTFDLFASYEYDSVLYNFQTTGCYDFDLRVFTDFGCFAEKHYPCAVEILENPVAAFNYTPEDPSSVQPFMEFYDASIAASKTLWVMDGDSIWNQSRVIREFGPSFAPYEIKLIAMTDAGCTDTVTHEIEYYEETLIHYPNSFTPDGDGLNDEFLILSEGTQLDGFDIIIYDRWGEQVFRSTRQSHGWDGRYTSGEYVPMGTYFFELHYRDRFNIERVLADEIHIVRTGTRVGF